MTDKDSLLSLASLVGVPYEVGANGPLSFDCWGLARFVYLKLGFETPNFPAIDRTHPNAIAELTGREALSDRWVPLDEPEDFCLVAMGRNNKVTHVGIWLAVDGGKVLHAASRFGVMLHNVREVKKIFMYKTEFYRWHEFS